MQTEKLLLVVSIQATATITEKQLVDYTGAPCADGERALGVARHGADSGDWLGVASHGELLVQAGAAVAVGAELQSDASARAITKTTGVAVGVARDAASAAGDLIRMLR